MLYELKIPCEECISYAICYNSHYVQCSLLNNLMGGNYVSKETLKRIRLKLNKEKIFMSHTHGIEVYNLYINADTGERYDNASVS